MTAPDNAALPPGADGNGNIPPGGSGPGNIPPGGNPGHIPPGGGPGNIPPGGGPGNIPPGDNSPGRIILVLGGIRSGKSRFAEQLAAQLAGDTETAPSISDNPGADGPGLSDEAVDGAVVAPDSAGGVGGGFVGDERPAVGGGAARGAVLYLATGVVSDEAMAQRIAAHRARRPAHWLTLETPQHPAAALREYAAAGWPGNGGVAPPVVLLDSVDGWIANLLLSADGGYGPAPGDEAAADIDKESVIKEAMAQTGALLHRLRAMPGYCILVSSEVGHSLVAETALGRQFQDILGLVNQELAAVAHQVYLAVAGLPVQIKPPPTSAHSAPE